MWLELFEKRTRNTEDWVSNVGCEGFSMGLLYSFFSFNASALLSFCVQYVLFRCIRK